jgi:dihydroorotate dehydrogenase
MYDVFSSYEDNYKQGPKAEFLSERSFSKINYLTKPKYSFLGIPLHIPFGVPAGPLLNAAYVKVALDAGFCLPVYKTVRSCYWPAHNLPNILHIQSDKKALFANDNSNVIGKTFKNSEYFNSPLSISNSFGVPSQKPEVWQNDFHELAPFAKCSGKHVVLSFQGSHKQNSQSQNSNDDFLEDIFQIATMATDSVRLSGFRFLEINLSCPNENATPLFKDVLRTIKIIKLVNKVIIESKANIKLIIKIGVLCAEDVKRLISETVGMLHAISAINTVAANIKTSSGNVALGSGVLSGGVCGSLILEQGLTMVSLLAETRTKLGILNDQLGIIGAGGVFTAREFHSYIAAGADVVQVATGMMWNLGLASEIADSLRVPYQKIVEIETHDS